MQFIIAHIADDTAVCDMVSVSINDLREAIVVVEKTAALSIENIPYAVNIYDIRNVTAYTCVSPYKSAVKSDFAAFFIGLTGIVHARSASVLLHIFIYSLCLVIVRFFGKGSIISGYDRRFGCEHRTTDILSAACEHSQQ